MQTGKPCPVLCPFKQNKIFSQYLPHTLNNGIYYELYGPTLEIEEIWAIIADEVDDDYENDPGECS